MDTFTVTVGQLVLSGPRDVYDQIEEAFVERPQTDLLVLPEFATQYNVDLELLAHLQESPEAMERAERWTKLVPRFPQVKTLADRVGRAVLFGCLPQEDDLLFSRAYFYDPHRRQLAFYDKSHVHWTENFLTAGAKIRPIQTRFGRIGILMCYDMAFSEAPRLIGIQGAEVLFALSAIPIDFHWRYAHRRMIGAATFNQYYVVAANLGHTPEAPMGGHSGIYSPKGDLIAQIEDAHAGCISAEIDLDRVRRWREEEIIYPHRRPHLYQAITEPVENA